MGSVLLAATPAADDPYRKVHPSGGMPDEAKALGNLPEGFLITSSSACCRGNLRVEGLAEIRRLFEEAEAAIRRARQQLLD